MLIFKPEKLQKLLDERGIKPTPLSLSIGSNRTLISDILKVKSTPTVNTILKISNELDVNPEYFWNDEPQAFPIMKDKTYSLQQLAKMVQEQASNDDVLRPIAESFAKVLEERAKK